MPELLTTPGFWFLAAIALVVSFLSRRVTAEVERASEDLSEEEIAEFRQTYAKPAHRTSMPLKYTRYAAATDRAKRYWMTGIGAITLALFTYVYLGPDLGLGSFNSGS